MDSIEVGYFGLFLLTFLSATILPLSSELMLILMLTQNFSPLTCLIVATSGNSLGGITNYIIGRLGNIKWLKRIGVKEEKIHKTLPKIQKFGAYMAFLSWVPFIGDLFIIALGFFRVSFTKVTLFMVIGKFTRYLIIIYFLSQLNA
jgi:membrane protein YqaA with SNARE-associated domain